MPVIESLYGKTPEGASVFQYTMKSSAGITATVMSYGANLLSVKAGWFESPCIDPSLDRRSNRHHLDPPWNPADR